MTNPNKQAGTWRRWGGRPNGTKPMMKLGGGEEYRAGQMIINAEAYRILGKPERVMFLEDGDNRFAIAASTETGGTTRAVINTMVINAKKFLTYVDLLCATDYFELTADGDWLTFDRATVLDAAVGETP